jgi:hypothetical protein
MRRQDRESTQLTSRRLVAEARHLVQTARRLAEEASRLQKSAWEFSVTCPQGHEAAQAAFDRVTLAKLLKVDSPVDFHCPVCGCDWPATRQQRDTLDWALRNRP